MQSHTNKNTRTHCTVVNGGGVVASTTNLYINTYARARCHKAKQNAREMCLCLYIYKMR